MCVVGVPRALLQFDPSLPRLLWTGASRVVFVSWVFSPVSPPDLLHSGYRLYCNFEMISSLSRVRSRPASRFVTNTSSRSASFTNNSSSEPASSLCSGSASRSLGQIRVVDKKVVMLRLLFSVSPSPYNHEAHVSAPPPSPERADTHGASLHAHPSTNARGRK